MNLKQSAVLTFLIFFACRAHFVVPPPVETFNLTDIGQRGWTAFASDGTLCSKTPTPSNVVIMLDAFDPMTASDGNFGLVWNNGVPLLTQSNQSEPSYCYGKANFIDSDRSAIITFDTSKGNDPNFGVSLWLYCTSCQVWTRWKFLEKVYGWNMISLRMSAMYNNNAEVIITDPDRGTILLQGVAVF